MAKVCAFFVVPCLTLISIIVRKIKVIGELPLNFNSTAPQDFVEALNRIAEEFGGVSNMGVFADIISVHQSNEMLVRVEDKYVAVSIKNYEKPHCDLTVTTNVSDPYQLDLDTLVGKNGSNIPSSLEQFLENNEEDELEDEESDADNGDEDIEDELEDEESDADNEDEDLKTDGKDDEKTDAFHSVGKVFSTTFKETASVFKGVFTFKK
ncbi:MAG: hypothetical protein K6E73_06180 [Bacteroidales bacterium]|nr:hypothetical protein [Bacteroidales bacterium]